LVSLILLALLAFPSGAGAHVQVSDRENNRYIKLTPTADRVRLAYTVYMGQVPGAQARRRLDRNRDGLIDDAEAKPFGDELAQAVAAGLRITVDGVEIPVQWHQISVGLGTPETSAGAFSVDLIAWICVPRARGEQRITMLDTYRVPIHGETELRAEESPGVHITRSALSDDPRQNAVEHKWRGGAAPTAHEPYELSYEVSPDAIPTTSEPCAHTAHRSDGTPPSSNRWLALAALLLLTSIAALLIRRRRRH
jgi:LPXTG-motif cell wall-anchored protein